MISNIVRPIGRKVIGNAVIGRCSSHHQYHLIPKGKVMMDLMPVPEGPWEVLHQKRQQKANLHLALGTLFFVFTSAVAYSSGYFFCNAFTPDLPKK